MGSILVVKIVLAFRIFEIPTLNSFEHVTDGWKAGFDWTKGPHDLNGKLIHLPYYFSFL